MADILDSIVFDDSQETVAPAVAVGVSEFDSLDELDDLDSTGVYDLNIKVFGVGGGGGNAVSHMAERGISDIKYVAVNTDLPALRKKDKTKIFRMQIGKKTTGGKGAGGDPEKAAKSAEESMTEIDERLEGATIAVITAGMGGGTGTGAAPVIARAAREKGILTFGVVTKPFDFEGTIKMSCALKGIAQLKDSVDALIVVPNEALLRSRDPREKEPTMLEAFAMADEVVYSAVKGVADLLHNTTYVNVDYADLERTIKGAGIAHVAFGASSGERKVDEVFEQLIHCPLLETSIASAKKLLVNIHASADVSSIQLDDLMKRIQGSAHPDAETVFGFDGSVDSDDYISAFLIATAYDSASAAEISFTSSRREERVPANSVHANIADEPHISQVRQTAAVPQNVRTSYSAATSFAEYKQAAGATGAMPGVRSSSVNEFIITNEMPREEELAEVGAIFKRAPNKNN